MVPLPDHFTEAVSPPPRPEAPMSYAACVALQQAPLISYLTKKVLINLLYLTPNFIPWLRKAEKQLLALRNYGSIYKLPYGYKPLGLQVLSLD